MFCGKFTITRMHNSFSSGQLKEAIGIRRENGEGGKRGRTVL